MATVVGFPAKDLREKNHEGWGRVASAPSCSRCGGLMVIEQCFDIQDDTGQLDVMARRCVHCGEVIDPVIEQNRQRQLPLRLGGGYRKSGVSLSAKRW